MNQNFALVMMSKSDDELQKYITESSRYTPEAVYAAIVELRFRGIFVSEATMHEIFSSIRQREEKDKKWENIVTDPNAPQLYSRRSIAINTTFFSVLTGAVLLSTNTLQHGKKKSLPALFLFAAIYLTLTIVGIAVIQPSLFTTVSCLLTVNIAGAFILDQHFWTACLGDQIAYRTRSVDYVLPICVAIIWIEIVSYILRGNLVLF